MLIADPAINIGGVIFLFVCESSSGPALCGARSLGFWVGVSPSFPHLPDLDVEPVELWGPASGLSSYEDLWFDSSVNGKVDFLGPLPFGGFSIGTP